MISSFAELAEQAGAAIADADAALLELCRTVDPLSLLSTLALLHLTSTTTDGSDDERRFSWERKLEHAVSVIASNALQEVGNQRLIGEAELAPAETALDTYYNQISILIAFQPTAEKTLADVRTSIRLASFFVREDAPTELLKVWCSDLYGPHAQWLREHLGYSVDDALQICATVQAVVNGQMAEATAAARLASDRETGMRDLWGNVHISFSFSLEQIVEALDGSVSREAVVAFFDQFAAKFGTLEPSAAVLELTPLRARPFLVHEGRLFLFVPPMLHESVFNVLHFSLMRSGSYFETYKEARSAWLEVAAIECLRRIWPHVLSGRSLHYGPKATRYELDGLVYLDGKLLLIECKWKTLTLEAQHGFTDALRLDVEESVIAAFQQATRAAEYVRAADASVEFKAADGSIILVDPKKVDEIIPISILGRSALNVLVTNPRLISELGFDLKADNFVAFSLADLIAISRTMEFKGQFIDYLRRRREVLVDGRFRVHDDWDLLSLYFVGALDPKDPDFQKLDWISYSAEGRPFADLLARPDCEVPASLRRRIPSRFRWLLQQVESGAMSGWLNISAFMLGLSDRQMADVDDALVGASGRFKVDGRCHDQSGLLVGRSAGVTVVCGPDARNVGVRLVYLSELNRQRTKSLEWLGIGVSPDGVELVLLDRDSQSAS